MTRMACVEADVLMKTQSDMRNRVLLNLVPADFRLLAAHLEPYTCAFREVLVEANLPISFLYFPESGIASVIARSDDGQQAEVGIIGREGFVHPAAALGVDRIPDVVQVQVAGDALRVTLKHVMIAMEDSETLRRTLTLVAQTHAVQTTCTTLANAIQQTEQRLARWLLMCHDRSDGDHILLTHDFMAVMLSVRRPSVTNALHVLEGKHLIRSERGMVTIRNRGALESYVGSSYGKPEAEYRRLLWPS